MGDFERKLKLADIRVGLMDLIIRRDQADSAESAYMAALPPELKLMLRSDLNGEIQLTCDCVDQDVEIYGGEIPLNLMKKW